MNYAIISDSSSDILSIPDIYYKSVPLKIITDNKEYVDNESLDVNGMLADLSAYNGVSKSSCPNIEDFESAFSDATDIFCITITRNLSGSYNSARLALEEHLSAHPEKRGHIFDTLTVGPENALIIEKLSELIHQGLDFETIKSKVNEYKKTTHLIFCLESLRNLANNGRISGMVAKLSSLLGIRVIGKASAEGTLEVTNKARGNSKAVPEIFKNMLKNGYNGGNVHIHHCCNISSANELSDMICKNFENAIVKIRETRALCSFYAEKGGLLVGYEGM